MTIVAIVMTTSCGGSPEPHGSSVADHERIAQKHERAAEGIEEQCAKARRNELTAPVDAEPAAIERLDRPGEPCWKAPDKRFLDAHRDAAKEHRAASASLRAAEARACVGIPEDDRVISPFERSDDIASVEPFLLHVPVDEPSSYRRPVGAVVTFRAVPGLTAEWLQREIDCHLARNTAVGNVVPEMPDCPLVPRDVEAHVRATGTGFAVELRSDDPETAREILDRAERELAKAKAAARR